MSKKKSKDASSKKRRKVPVALLIPAVLMLIVVLQASFVLILLGLLPTVIAYYADTTRDRLGVATIACCNLAGVVPHAVDLVLGGNKWNMLGHYVGSGTVWLSMYGMALVGYGLIRLCPMLFNIVMVTMNTSKVFQLQQRQDALIKEWGEHVTPKN
jgi:hypothetical protein